MTQTTFTFEQIDALRRFIEFHTESFADDESEAELNEIVGTDVAVLYDTLLEMLEGAE